MLPKLTVICGPTASGKTSLSINMAKKLGNSIIISADSRQVYKMADLGTAKINLEEMQGIPHYCLDLYDINQKCTVADWVKEAQKVIEENLDKNIFVVGGTGFYIDSLIYGLSENSKSDDELRSELSLLSLEDLQSRYLKLKSELGDTKEIDLNNPRRLIRRVEILLTDGKLKEIPREKKYEVEFVYLDIDNETLKSNIRKRFTQNVNGIIEETKNLLKSYSKERLAEISTEYKQVIKYLDSLSTTNPMTIEELIDNVTHKDYQYAKRQKTWFKKYIN